MAGDEACVEWAVLLCSPLVASNVRVAVEDQLVSESARQPQQYLRWFAGFLEDMIRTLPAADPWRKVSGRITTSDVTILCRNGFGVPPDGMTSGLIDDRVFGTWRDGEDFHYPVSSNLLPDPVMAALVHPLTRQQSALWAFAVAGRAREAVRFLDPENIAALFMPTSLRALWRRRCYAGPDDMFHVEVAMHHHDRVFGSGAGREMWRETMALESFVDADCEEWGGVF